MSRMESSLMKDGVAEGNIWWGGKGLEFVEELRGRGYNVDIPKDAYVGLSVANPSYRGELIGSVDNTGITLRSRKVTLERLEREPPLPLTPKEKELVDVLNENYSHRHSLSWTVAVYGGLILLNMLCPSVPIIP